MAQTTKESENMSDHTEAVEHHLKGVDHVAPGSCPGCAECGLEDFPTGDEDGYDHASTCADEGNFSWRQCEGCGSTFGGDRYHAHGFIDGEVCHLDVCVDCLMYLANGDLPPEPWYSSPYEQRAAPGYVPPII